eukprot:3164267-Pleurochrysis_carterae.AAC.3
MGPRARRLRRCGPTAACRRRLTPRSARRPARPGEARRLRRSRWRLRVGAGGPEGAEVGGPEGAEVGGPEGAEVGGPEG